MATRIRLQRHGHKGYAFYHIVIADSRAPRDGKFVERIGSYNPNTNPATIDLKFDRALYWIMTGAQPSDTVRNILSDEGVMLKKHLLGGVKKGAFTEADAETKFQTWKQAKMAAVEAVANNEKEAEKNAAQVKLEAEKALNKARSEEIAKKKADEIAKKNAELQAAAAEQAAAVVEEEAVAEESAPAPTEEPAAE